MAVRGEDVWNKPGLAVWGGTKGNRAAFPVESGSRNINFCFLENLIF